MIFIIIGSVVVIFILLYILGASIKKKEKKLEEEQIAKAEKGDIQAQYDLAQKYESKKEWDKTVNWYKKAADNGHKESQNKLGNFYSSGTGGTAKDEVQAVNWYKKAAAQGLAVAYTNLGYCYKDGHGVQKDLTQALEYFEKAVQHGDEFGELGLEEIKEQLQKEKYKNDLLSGAISLKSELLKITSEMDIYKADHEEYLVTWQNFTNAVKAGTQDSYQRSIVHNHELKSFKDCIAKLDELLEILPDNYDIKKLRDDCYKLEHVYLNNKKLQDMWKNA